MRPQVRWHPGRGARCPFAREHPWLAGALRRLRRAAGETPERHVERLLLDAWPKRSSCKASTPTPILSAVLPMASAALIE
jgi:hypothetical protein